MVLIIRLNFRIEPPWPIFDLQYVLGYLYKETVQIKRFGGNKLQSRSTIHSNMWPYRGECGSPTLLTDTTAIKYQLACCRSCLEIFMFAFDCIRE